jgi:hypothetical protein
LLPLALREPVAEPSDRANADRFSSALNGISRNYNFHATIFLAKNFYRATFFLDLKADAAMILFCRPKMEELR